MYILTVQADAIIPTMAVATSRNSNIEKAAFYFVAAFLTCYANVLKYDGRKILSIKSTRAFSNSPPVLIHENFVPVLGFLNNKCLVHIVNFQGVDLPPQNRISLILTRFQVVNIRYSVHRPWTHQNFTETRNRVMYTNELAKLTEPKLTLCILNGDDLDSRECIQDIPHLDQTPKIKPWNCERHVYLFPPKYSKGNTFFRWEPHTDSHELIVPDAFRKFWVHQMHLQPDQTVTKQTHRSYLVTTREIFEILVVNRQELSTIRRWSLGLTRIRDAFGFANYYTTSNRELFVVETKWNQHHHDILSVVYLLCRYCKRCHPLFMLPITQIGSGMLKYSDIRNAINLANQPIHYIVARISGFGKWVHAFKSSGWQLQKSSKYHTIFHRNMRKRFQDITSFQYYDNLETIRELLSNMTLYAIGEYCKYYNYLNKLKYKEVTNNIDKSGGKPGCGCADNLEFIPVFFVAPTGPFEHSDIYFHTSSLKFVSCGVSNESSLNFRSLVWIFKLEVWLVIIAIWILVSLVSYLLQNITIRPYGQPIEFLRWNDLKSRWKQNLHLNIIPNVLTYLKGFLEQGNPLRPILWRDDRSAFIHCLFLLMILSISNLYKNDNISELTLPRKPVPYDTFEIIASNGFDIFTRPVEVIWGAKLEIEFPGFLKDIIAQVSKKFMSRERKHYYFLTISELYYYALSQTKFMDFGGANSEENITEVAKTYLNRTKVVDNWANLVISSNNNTNFDIVNACNKTAVWLPDNEALQLYFRMKKGPTNRKVFLSNTPFFPFTHGIRFHHWIPQKIIDKGKFVSENGVNIWLERLYLFAIRLRSGYRGEEAGKTTLAGNIVVVLLIIPVGLSISSVSFAWEMRHIGKTKVIILWGSLLNAFKRMITCCRTLPSILRGFRRSIYSIKQG